MPDENRIPSTPVPPRRGASPPFCRVERRGADGRTRLFVVHTGSPKFVVEFECDAPAGGGPGDAQARSRPVIRRVCVPNSWAGEYHRCARQLGAAEDFAADTETPPT